MRLGIEARGLDQTLQKSVFRQTSRQSLRVRAAASHDTSRPTPIAQVILAPGTFFLQPDWAGRCQI
jgi:hypothetical protein